MCVNEEQGVYNKMYYIRFNQENIYYVICQKQKNKKIENATNY